MRVEGSRFVASSRPTAKLEGARIAGYETLSLVGIRDPAILDQLDVWAGLLRGVIEERVRTALGREPHEYGLALRFYGAYAVLGPLDRAVGPAREVGLLCKVLAADQATATAIAKTANPYLLHLPLPGMERLPSFAFATSPAEVERGPSYKFVLNHVIEMDTATELFRCELTEVRNG